MFHFPDSSLISAFLLVFMASVAGCDGRVPVAGGKRVKNSHINEGSFKTPPSRTHSLRCLDEHLERS